MPFLIAFLVLLAVLIAVLLIRTLTFKPKAEVRPTPEAVFVNTEKAVADLSEMIKCRTVSDRNKDNEQEGEFDKFKALLERIFPSVYSKCEVEYVGTRAILIKWSGKSSAAPTVLMSHFDVVSVVEENWTKPAFEGIIENGVLWGRGTLDTKGTLNGALQAAESLISDGFVPENDIYFAFGGDEEINGQGSPSLVKLFKESFVRHKVQRCTQKKTCIRVEPELAAIAEKYQGEGRLFNFAAGFRSLQYRMCDNYAELSKELGFKVNMEIIRRTWATLAGEIECPEIVIDKSMGHVARTVNGRFYEKYDWSRTAKWNRRIIDYVKTGQILS
ncbi:MAG: M20/M25/M40 family metallo-hydrolase [Clostridia bacterium]|nr:M20/M25/M40 family metallo-hydrolase [Clostridia bacterium]